MGNGEKLFNFLYHSIQLNYSALRFCNIHLYNLLKSKYFSLFLGIGLSEVKGHTVTSYEASGKSCMCTTIRAFVNGGVTLRVSQKHRAILSGLLLVIY